MSELDLLVKGGTAVVGMDDAIVQTDIGVRDGHFRHHQPRP